MSGQEEDKKAVTPCSYDKDQESIYRINIFISGAQNGLAWLNNIIQKQKLGKRLFQNITF